MDNYIYLEKLESKNLCSTSDDIAVPTKCAVIRSAV